ncbi:MAG: ComEC/Rec2 family competence protein [Candidatus Omnitrophica bacterium]|nr:ComEC/Rec2 family competence protein [Candidatus Omnitrophota bacterium]
MNKLLAGLTVFYGLGILLCGLIRLDYWLIMLVAVILLFFAVRTVKEKSLFLILVLFLALLAGCLNQKNSYRLPRCHIYNLFFFNGAGPDYSVTGSVSSVVEFRNGYYWFIMRAQEIQAGRARFCCCGKLLVKMDFTQELNYGENVTIIGNLNRIPGFNGASRRYRDFLIRQGIYLIMPVKDLRQIVRRERAGGRGLVSRCIQLRTFLEQIINRHLPELPASILCAMVLGQKRDIPWLVNNSMVRSGTVHILVVSGFNVGIVGLIINLLLKILRLPRKGRIILTAVCLLIYCLITGATNPVVRATVMGLVFLAAYFLKREPNIYNSLASAALLILAVNPQQLFDIGFQLSFISVLAIIYLYPKLKVLIRLELCKIMVLRFITEGCLVSLSAWLGTVLIIAWNFRVVVPVTVLANILIVPLAALITLCGFVLVLSGWFCPGLAGIFSLPTAALINLLLNINAALIKLPFAYIYF